MKSLEEVRLGPSLHSGFGHASDVTRSSNTLSNPIEVFAKQVQKADGLMSSPALMNLSWTESGPCLTQTKKALKPVTCRRNKHRHEDFKSWISQIISSRSLCLEVTYEVQSCQISLKTSCFFQKKKTN